MTQYYEVKGILENGDKYIIRVQYYDERGYYIDDISLTPKGKRKEFYVMGRLDGNYSYRKLGTIDRRKAQLKLFVSIVGEEILNSALQEAWLNKKPKLLVSSDYDIQY